MAYESKSESARNWFTTMYGAGKGIAEGIEKANKKKAGKALTESQNAAIPTTQQSDKALTTNYDGGTAGMSEQDFRTGTGDQFNLKYGQDLEAYYKRKNDAMNEYAAYSSPEEMVSLEDTYNKSNRRKYQLGLQRAADMLEQEADPRAISQQLTSTYALNPTGVSGVATPSPDGHGVVMSFFDEVTGKTQATVPLTDPEKLRIMAAGVDDPTFAPQFNITKAKLKDQVKRTDIMQGELNNTVKKDKAGAATDLLQLDEKLMASVNTRMATMDKKLVDRGDANAKAVLAGMKEFPMPSEYNGEFTQYYANATGIMTENPNMDVGAALRATQLLDEGQRAMAVKIMEGNPGMWEGKYDPATGRVPPGAMAEAYKGMVSSGQIIKAKHKNGQVSHVLLDGKNKILLPPVITGEGNASTRIGMMYQAYQSQGGSMLTDKERMSLKDVVMQYAGAGRAETGAATPASASGGLTGIPGPDSAPEDTDKKPFSDGDRAQVIGQIGKIIAAGDGANMARLMMNVTKTFGPAVAQLMANEAERMMDAKEQGPAAPIADAPTQAATALPGNPAVPGSAGIQPVDPLGGLKQGYNDLQQYQRDAGINPAAVARPR